jgi:hypothetical protein
MSLIDHARRIRINTTSWTVEYIVTRYTQDNATSILYLPVGQREWAWKGNAGLSKKRTLIDSVMHNYPIPSCIVNSELVDGRERYPIYDGRHRMETLRMFFNNEFAWKEGVYFRDLCVDDQAKFMERTIPVTITTNASHQQLADVFVRLNAGVALKASDFCWAYRNAPLVAATCRLVRHERLATVLGGFDMNKRTMLANWTGLVLALSRNDAGMMTNSWIRVSPFLDDPVDEGRVITGIDAYATLLERANAAWPVAAKIAGSYAKIGYITAFFFQDWLTAADPDGKEAAMTKWLDIIGRLRSGTDEAVGMRAALKTSGAQNLTAERIAVVLRQVTIFLNGGVINGDGEDPDDDDSE